MIRVEPRSLVNTQLMDLIVLYGKTECEEEPKVMRKKRNKEDKNDKLFLDQDLKVPSICFKHFNRPPFSFYVDLDPLSNRKDHCIFLVNNSKFGLEYH